MQKTLRELGSSILLAIVAVCLVLGGISLALAEGFIPAVSNPFVSSTPSPVIGTATSPAQPVIDTVPPLLPSDTPVPSAISCTPPSGWLAIRVQPGDTLASLALAHGTSADLLTQGNCQLFDPLLPDTLVYVPPPPVRTSIPCGRPAGWIIYILQPGNTLYSLSHAYGVSIAQLQQANCMSSGQTALKAGQQFWVPNVITRTPLASSTPSLTPVSIIFPTLTASMTTAVPSAIPTATGTPTPTATATATQILPSATQPPTSTASITAFP